MMKKNDTNERADAPSVTQTHGSHHRDEKRKRKHRNPSPESLVDDEEPTGGYANDRLLSDDGREGRQGSPPMFLPASKLARTNEEDQPRETQLNGGHNHPVLTATQPPSREAPEAWWHGEPGSGPAIHHARHLPSPHEPVAGGLVSQPAPGFYPMGQEHLPWGMFPPPPPHQQFIDPQHAAANAAWHHQHRAVMGHPQGASLMPPTFPPEQLFQSDRVMQPQPIDRGGPHPSPPTGPPYDPYAYANAGGGYGQPRPMDPFMSQQMMPPGHNVYANPVMDGQQRSMPPHMTFLPQQQPHGHQDFRHMRGASGDAHPPYQQHSVHPPVPLYTRNDDEILSDYQVFLRKQIEFFSADSAEVNTAAPGRKKQVVLGQVGIRCKHCANLLADRRTAATVYFPSKLRGLYQAAQNIATTHLGDTCPSMPDSVKAVFSAFQREGKRASAGHGGKQYWADAARAIGVIEAEDGLRFSR